MLQNVTISFYMDSGIGNLLNLKLYLLQFKCVSEILKLITLGTFEIIFIEI